MNLRIRTAITATAASLLLVTALSACSGGSGSGGTPHMDAPPDTAAVYKANCVSCHGSDLQGRVGPDTNLQKVGARMTEAELVEQITDGGSRMPSQKGRVTEQEIAALAAWLAQKK
ncbi:c-type cytochrome [Paenibacillus protaetiae]|uniref:Cytochrome c n=1 Tax=Paenibacillus protaetiae TaxID=2509456 RepID=A0A4P6EZ93_9BACL|nr:cytochrome c [Paenibacillus protaetiae]QAY68095.1 cytochrome c [Paenibacillus protaetiae]